MNPLDVTRSAWAEVAGQAGASLINVEVRCSDAIEHRRRVEARASDIPEFQLPSWEEVVAREYQAWAEEHIVIDTAAQNVESCLKELRTAPAARALG